MLSFITLQPERCDLVARWITDVLLIGVVSFIGYVILIGIEKKQIANLVLTVSIMLGLLTTMQDLTPVFERWSAKVDSFQDTADRLSGVGKGDWEIPMAGNITQGYNPTNHGIDIAGQAGTNVWASKGGKVTRVEYNETYGNFVVVDHGRGLESLYAHLNGIGVRVGWNIVTKARIGTCGSTGNSTGPHLHFEIRRNGQTVDPMGYLK